MGVIYFTSTYFYVYDIRYITAFDSDRTALKNAYSNSAQFSYKIHDVVSQNTVAAAFLPLSEVERFVSRKGDRNLYKCEVFLNKSCINLTRFGSFH